MCKAAFKRMIGLAAGAWGLAGTAAAEIHPDPADRIAPAVQLPAFIVRDNRVLPPRESWHYVAAPGLEALSTVSASETTQYFRDFFEFHRAVGAVWPLAQMNAAVPACLILCGRQKQFAPFVPEADRAQARGMLSVSYQDRELSSIVIELDSGALQEQVDGASEDMSQYTSDLIHREYVHFLLGRIGDRVPPWLEQGLWQVFLSMKTSGDLIGLPALSLPDELAVRKKGADTDLRAALQAGAFCSLEGLLTAKETPSELNHTPWASECYELVHFCLFGEKGRYRPAFLQFAQLSSRLPPDEAMFRRCFGIGYAEFLPRLWRYTGWSADLALEITDKTTGKGIPLPDFKAREATDGEVGRIKGETLRMAGRLDEAHWALIAPYQRGSRDPQLLASLGLQEEAAHLPDRATPFLEAATAAYTTRARAWAMLGQLRLAAALAHPSGPGGTLAAAQLKVILEPLFAGRALAPPLPELYQTAAAAWSHSGIKPTAGHLALIDEGVAKFPFDADLVYADARVHEQFGYLTRAQELCALGEKYATRPEDRARLAELQHAWSSPAGGPP